MIIVLINFPQKNVSLSTSLSFSHQQYLIKNVMQKLIWKILYSIKLITNFITHTILLSSSILLPIQETNINITYTVGFFYFDFFFRNGNNSLIL